MDRPQFFPAFHFRVDFLGLGGDDIDTRFQSVAGLTVTIETDSLVEGGENRFQHTLPNRTAYEDIVLKRGLVKSSSLVDWFRETLATLEIRPVDVNISLLNESHDPVMTWKVKNAWPKKWSVADFDAESSAIVIETLELGYQHFSIG